MLSHRNSQRQQEKRAHTHTYTSKKRAMYVIKLEQVLCTAYLGVVFTFARFIKPHQSVKITARLTRIEIVIFFFLRSINSIVVTVAVVVFVVAVVHITWVISIFHFFSSTNSALFQFSVAFKFLYSTKQHRRTVSSSTIFRKSLAEEKPTKTETI